MFANGQGISASLAYCAKRKALVKCGAEKYAKLHLSTSWALFRSESKAYTPRISSPDHWAQLADRE